MPNPVATLLDKHLGPHFWPRLKRETIGLATDFWADGAENPFKHAASAKANRSAREPLAAVAQKGPTAFRRLLERNRIKLAEVPLQWSASAADLADIMYGPGFILPGGGPFYDRLIAPLGLQSGMRVLDLSAGLGGGLRSLGALGTKAEGLESDPLLAARLGAYEIKPFDPASFDSPPVYEAIVVRDLFFRIPGKQRLFQALADAVTPQGRLAFSDYVLNPEHHGETAIKAWRRSHNNAEPWSLMELAEAWAKAGFKLAETEDLTDDHRRDIRNGLKKLTNYLAGGLTPDTATKHALLIQLQLASQTLAAMEKGLRFYRFLAIKL